MVRKRRHVSAEEAAAEPRVSRRRRRTSAEEQFLRRPSTAGGVVEGGVSADEGVIGQIHLEQDEAITLPSRELRDEERTEPLELPPQKAQGEEGERRAEGEAEGT